MTLWKTAIFQLKLINVSLIFELAAVVADLEMPMDIPEARWVDIRLHEEPEPEPKEEHLSETPFNFQPTNLSEAVSAAMVGIAPPEPSETSDETQ